jgi:predicted nucleic acid-binding protein
MDDDIFRAAARLEPRSLRSLDAIHLASALSLGADLGAIVIYDSNMAAAAEGHGLQVLAPGPNASRRSPPRADSLSRIT